MESNRKKNSIRNMIWGFFNRIVILVTPFILRTMMIQLMGMNYLGLNNLFASVLQIFNIAELGFETAVAYNLYKPIAENDEETICALMAFYKKAYMIIGIIITILGLLLLPYLPNLIKGSYPEDINLYTLYLMYLFNTASGYFLFSYKKVLLVAHQRVDIANKVSSSLLLVCYFIQGMVLVKFRNYYIYYSITFVITICTNLLIGYVVDRRYPKYKPRGKLSEDQRASLWKRLKGLIISKLSGQTKNAFDSVILSSSLGLVILAQYGNYFYIMNNLATILAVFVTAAEASVGNSIAVESTEKNYNTFTILEFLYAWITGVCCVCLVWLYQPFMELWVGKENCYPQTTEFLFGIYFFLLTSCVVRNIFINTSGLWWENRYKAIGSAISNLVLNVIFVRLWGINGVIIATLIALLAFDFIFTTKTLFKYRFQEYKIYKYFFWWTKHFFFVVSSVIVCGFLCSYIKMEGIKDFIIKGIVCFICTNLIFFVCYRASTEFKSAKAFVISMFHL